MTLDVKATEMLADADSVALVISASLERAGTGLAAQFKVTDTFRRSGLETDLVNSLGDPDPGVHFIVVCDNPSVRVLQVTLR